jgi:uncharacterized Tic20 family protein
MIDDSNSRTWALSAHLSGLLAGYVIPFGGILAPFIIWLVKKEDDPFVRDHALEALNFQITVWLALIICIPLVFVVIGIPMIFVIAIGAMVYSIIATIKAGSGEAYRYPFCWRLVSN